VERRTEGTIRGYRDLIAWQKAMALVKNVYEATRDWPSVEQFGLTSQVRRAVVSVPANIAEGQGRYGSRELLHHLSVAHGSLCEVETLMLIAVDLEYLD
jgi:four helix bundle protein